MLASRAATMALPRRELLITAVDRDVAPALISAVADRVPALPGRPGALSDAAVEFVEPPEGFLALSVRHFALTLATLGFYYFWARAEARQALHRSIRIGGRSLDYSGTGQEGFVSFLLAMSVMAAVVSVFLALFTSASSAAAMNGLGFFSEFRWQRLTITLPLLFLLGSVVYRKRKHVLRRTWLGQQNFDLAGRPWSYAVHHFWSAFLIPLTLGWAAPWRANMLERRKVQEMRFGETTFRHVGDVRPLYKAFAVLWFGGGVAYVATMLALGLTIGPDLLAALQTRSISPLMYSGSIRTAAFIAGAGLAPLILLLLYYRAAWIEHQISSLAVSDVRLKLNLPRFRFALLMMRGAALKFVTLGAFAPLADAQMVRFVIAHVRTEPAPVER